MMNQTTQLADLNLAKLYTIPLKEWKAINNRVQKAILAADIEETISESIPHYPDLLTVSRNWKANLFPSLVRNANQLKLMAAVAQVDLQTLQQMASTLPEYPTELPKNVEQGLNTYLQNINRVMPPLRDIFKKDSRQLLDFRTVNTNVDLDLERNQSGLGRFWKSIGQSIEAVELANGHMNGAWSAIGGNLKSAMNADISTQLFFLINENIQIALSDWKIIEEVCGDFLSMAPEL